MRLKQFFFSSTDLLARFRCKIGINQSTKLLQVLKKTKHYKFVKKDFRNFVPKSLQELGEWGDREEKRHG